MDVDGELKAVLEEVRGIQLQSVYVVLQGG